MSALRLLAVILLLPCAGCACPTGRQITVRNAEAVVLAVCAEVAETEEERRRGLMDHPPLEADEGLLLAFPYEGEVCIYNENVDFDIDVIYANAEGEVVGVEREVPAGDPTVRCRTRVASVLEVGAGVASDVRIGDRFAA